jgi:hypothetical protein
MEYVPPAMARNTSQWANYTFAQHEQHLQQQQGDGGGGGACQFEVHPMERLTDAVATLIYSPRKFDRIASEQTDTLNASVKDMDTLESVVNTIFNSCMTEKSFRSSGARLFASLSSTVNVNIEGETFRSVLLKKCELEIAGQTDDAARNRTLALFLAELFVHLKEASTEVASDEVAEVAIEGVTAPKDDKKVAPKRVASLADSVVQILTALCNEQNRADAENLRAAAEGIKMSGGALEDEEKLRKPDSATTPQLDALMSAAEAASKADSVPADAKEKLSKLADMRKAGWPEAKEDEASASAKGNGIDTRNKVVIQTAPPNPKPVLTKPAAAPAGQRTQHAPSSSALSEEEIRFMNEHLGGGEACYTSDDFDPDLEALIASEVAAECAGDDEMSPEMAAAFEEFMANQGGK